MKIHIKIFFFVFTLITIKISNAISYDPIQLNDTTLETSSRDSLIITNSNVVIFNQTINNDPFNFETGIFSTNINGQAETTFLSSIISFIEDPLFDEDNQRLLNLDFLQNGILSTRSISLDGTSVFLSSGENPGETDGFNFFQLSASELIGTDYYYFEENNILYSVLVDGSQPAIRLSPEFPVDNEINFVSFDISSQNIIFSVINNVSNLESIFKVPTNGSSPATLLSVLPDNIIIDRFINASFFTDDNSKFIFNTLSFNQDTGEETNQIFSLNLTNPSDAVSLSAPFSGFSLRTEFSIINETVIYSFRNGFRDFSELYSANVNGTQNPILLDRARNIPEFQLSGSRVVYVKENNQEPTEIFSASIDGSSSPKSLSTDEAELNSFFHSSNIIISKSKDLVFYLSNQLSNDFENLLFSAPIDGSSPATLISPENINIIDIKLGVNETTIFYTSELNNSQLIQSNIDGSNFRVLHQLDAGQFPFFQLSPDGNYIVYSTADFISFESNLFSLKINESNEPLCFPIKAQNDNFVTICL